MRKEENYDLSGQNTFGMKVRCACYVEYVSAAELERMDWDSLPKPIKHIGEGSNLLFSGDFPGTVLHSDIEFIMYVDVGFDEVPVMVGAGVHWDNFVEETCRHGLWGAENLSLIPGETGAAAVQNIGAYGVEVKDIISGVVCYDLQERKKVKFTVAECGYGYRESMFKHAEGRYIVTSVLFRLTRKKSPKLEYKGLEALAAGECVTAASAVNYAMAGKETHLFRTDNAGRTANADDHGTGADLQSFVACQRRRHIEKELAGFHLDLQLSAGFLDGDGGVPVQLDGLGIVQQDVSAACAVGADRIAAVEAHILLIGQNFSSGVHDCDAAFRKLQPHDGSLRLCGRSGRSKAQHKEQNQNERKHSFHSLSSQALLVS